MTSKSATGPHDDPASAEGEFQQLMATLDANELTDRIFAAFAERLPAMRSVQQDVVTDVHAMLASSLRAVLGHLAAGASLASMSPTISEVAARRAVQGVPLEQSLLAYEIGSEILLDAVLARSNLVAPNRSGAVFGVAGRRILEYVQLTTAAVANGYHAASATAAVDREHELHAHLEALTGRLGDRRSLLEVEPLVGVTLPLRWCVVSEPVGPDGPELVRALRRRHHDALVGMLDRRVVLFAGSDDWPSVSELATGRAPVVDGNTARAFTQAVAAARVASHLGRPSAAADETGPLAAMLAMPERDAEAFVTSVLGPLMAEHRADDLVDTLRAYLANDLSLAAAARALYVHRHTMEYRMRRIAELTKLDLRQPLDRLSAELALFMLGDFP